MNAFKTLCCGLSCAALPLCAQDETPVPAPPIPLQLEWSEGTPLILVGPHATHQLVISSRSGTGASRDVTREARFQSDPEGIVVIDANGFVRTLGDGSAAIRATLGDSSSAPLQVTVTRFAEIVPVSFPNEVVPVLSRNGCNSGGCHGKAEGQNGFRLSLFGYEPWNDIEYLVKESRGRRIFRAAPEHSLLVLKATGELPHQGGSRIERDSDDYGVLVRWIEQGLSYGPQDDPKVTHIAASPRERLTTTGTTEQIRVTAHFDDGSTRDITRVAIYESNDEDMAIVDENGLVTTNDRPGSASVMIRFQEHVDVFRATLPLGAPVANMPAPVNVLDERIFAQLKTLGLPPSDLSDDSTFFRRVTIDIAGRIPTLEETNTFLADPDPTKRAKHIEALLASADYADYFAGKWAAILRNKRKQPHHAHGTFAFHSWIREALHHNTPYNEFVRQFVTASGQVRHNPPVVWYRTVTDRKEQLQDVAQIFLGIRLQCAQCHHHPYEKWSQDDYYGFEAFFSTVARKPSDQPGEEIIFHKHGNAAAQNPRTGRSLKPKPLGEEELALAPQDDPRVALADWMVNERNPFFAKMLVNRYWKHFFGRGLVDPEDDLRVTNPPSHPALLDSLATHFVESGYDLKALVRIICNSRTYQLSAIPNEHNLRDQQNYSRFYPRRLPAEVLLDAINLVTNSSEKFSGQPRGVSAVQLPDDLFTQESYFLSVFGRPDMNSACECERADDVNLAQALHLVNSANIRDKLASDQARAAQLVRSKDLTDKDRLTELYRRALSRAPDPEELSIGLEHLQRRRSQPAPAEAKDKQTPEQIERGAYEDIIWAVLNTKEFLFNH